MRMGATGCMHDTDPTPVRITHPSSSTYPIKWYRCKRCGKEFSERFPTVIMRPVEE